MSCVPAAPRHPARDALLIAGLAFALRFGIALFSNGGLGGLYGYDAGVYYGAADALIHGRVPYRDFILLHPPLLMLVLTPFAALGRITTDHAGYITANVAFNVLAALNAVLVWRIAGLWGFTRRAALIGGLFYAIWWGAITGEYGLRLEPLGTVLFLLAVLFLAQGRALPAGLALGATCCVKIWWAVPLLIVLTWHLARREQRPAAGRLAAGAAAAGVIIAGPFFALAASDTWHRVVTDQLGRRYNAGANVRIETLAGLRKAMPHLPTPLLAAAAAIIGALFVAAVVVGWRQAPARLAVAVLAAQFVLLMVSPSFFSFYGGFIAGSLSLTVAAASNPAPARWRLDHRVGLIAAGVAGLVTLVALGRSRDLVDPFPGATFERATAGLRCVITDSTSGLILMNRLSDDLEHGCPVWVDVTGHTYFGAAKSDELSRRDNPAWQHLLQRYLLSGDAAVIVRPPGTQPSAQTLRLLRRHPVIARGDGFVLYRITR